MWIECGEYILWAAGAPFSETNVGSTLIAQVTAKAFPHARTDFTFGAKPRVQLPSVQLCIILKKYISLSSLPPYDVA